MMAITTRSSINVNPKRGLGFLEVVRASATIIFIGWSSFRNPKSCRSWRVKRSLGVRPFLVLCALGMAAVSNALSGQPPDLSGMVVIGDSLLAGFRNSSLRADWQPEGIAAVIAQQAGVSLALP